MGRLNEKVAIITGATSGVGAATAIALAKERAKVVITGRNEENLANTAKACKEQGAEVLEIVADLERFENLEMIVAKAVKRFSKIDILVNSAGFVNFALVDNVSLEYHEKVFKVNIRAPVFLSKYSLPHLKKTKGCIVNVSSAVTTSTYPGVTTYTMTKAALDHFTRGFAAECVKDNVRVNSVNPGIIKTNFGIAAGLSSSEWEQFQRDVVLRQQLGVMAPEQVAGDIIFLCLSTHITGTVLVADAGYALQ